MSVNVQHRQSTNRLCVPLKGTMNRLITWLWTLLPLGRSHETNKVKKKRRRKKATSDADCKLLNETYDDVNTPTITQEQPSVGNSLITGCSSKPFPNFMSKADVHLSCPPEYDSGSLKTTTKHAGVYEDVDSQGDDCDEVDGHPTSLPQPLLPNLKCESLTMYYETRQYRPGSIIPPNIIHKIKTKGSSTKNEGDDKPGSHRFPDELGQRSQLCPVHHQTDVNNSMDKIPGCASSSGQCLGISGDKQTSVIKDPLVLGRQGSEKSQNNEFESELSDIYGTVNNEGSCLQDMFLPKEMPISEMGLETSSSCNIMCNESIFHKDMQSQSDTVTQNSEPDLICNTSLSTDSLNLMTTGNNSITDGKTSMGDMNESGDIHLSSIGSMTPINFSETFIQHQLSRSASISSIDDVSHISSEQASFSDIHDCRRSSYNSGTSYSDCRSHENSETLEGLWFKPITSNTDPSDAVPFSTTSAEDEGCDETDGPCFTGVEDIEVCSKKDGVVTSVGSDSNKPIIIKTQNLGSGYDISEDTSRDKQEIPKPQSRDSGYDTDSTKDKSKGASGKKPLTTTEKRRNAIMKRLAESTKATLAAYCSSGMYQSPKANDHTNASSKGIRNEILTDYMIERKERPMIDLISHPKADYPLQKSSENTDISESHSEMATYSTSANDSQLSKAVVQNPWQETGSNAMAKQCDSSSTDYSENLFKFDSSSKGLDENISDDDLNITEPDGMDEYFAAGSLIDPSDAVPFSKTSAQDEGCDETDGLGFMEGEYSEKEDGVTSEVDNSHSAPSTNSTTLMHVTPSSSDEPIVQTAYTNLPFKTKKSRFHSFGGVIWKLSNPNVEEIVHSGFHYIGPGDKTQCFSCGIILMEWESSDVPVEEHLRHSPNCSFIKSVASLHKQWLSPLIEGAIDIVKSFNQFENHIIDTAIEHLDLKDVYIFTAPQLLDEVYLIEENKEKEDLSILYLYGIQGATCQEITDEILQEELLLSLGTPDAGTSGVEDDQIVFQPIEGLEDEVGGLGAGFDSFLEIPAVQSDMVNASMLIYEEYTEEVQNLDGHQFCEEIYFSIHGEEERHNKVADTPEDIVDNLSVPSCSNKLDIRHDSGCISGEVSPQPPSEPQIRPMPRETCSEDEGLSYDTDYYSGEESEDEDQVDLATVSEPLPKTEEEKVDMEARLVSLRQTNDELRLWSACKVCLVKTVSELYIDCGHLAVCSSCTSHLQACPICRKPITNSMTVYLH